MASNNKNMQICRSDGYTLVELVIVMIIIGIMASVAMQHLGGAIDTTRFEETRDEMDLLADLIAGNPDLKSGGVRTDYGYIGDLGSLPPNWSALVSNPGYSTWNGPYVSDEFSSGGSDIEYKLDAWGAEYSTPNASSFTSNGGSTSLTRELSASVDDLLYNTVSVAVVDLDFSPPGATYTDSVVLILTYPNGAGSYNTKVLNPDAGGFVQFDSIPVGIHTLKTTYIPTNDTISRKININPGSNYYADIQLYENLWADTSAGGGGGGGTSCSAGDWKFPSAEGDEEDEWSRGYRAYSDDGQYTYEDDNGEENDWYNFNFGISSGATVCGIEIEMEGRSQSSWSDGNAEIELSWNGSSSYTSSGISIDWTGNSWQVKTAGGATETWGRTWSGSDFSNSNFRIMLTKEGDNNRALRIDYIKIRVYYYE